jgi:hypothetical protein
MEAVEEERSGVLVLRAWVETGGDHGLRVRITRITGTVQDPTVEPMSSALTTVDDACTMVRVWLEELQHGPQPPPESGWGSEPAGQDSQ